MSKHSVAKSGRCIQSERCVLLAAGLLLLAFLGLLWVGLCPDQIRGWREADTQTIALHLAENESSILRPRIDWGGAGPGYVETEFQLYAYLVSIIVRRSGDVAWAGQLVSALSTALAGVFVFFSLRIGHRPASAFLGLLAFLASRAVIVSATSVQPEALCLSLYCVALYAFLRFERSTSSVDLPHLLLFASAGALSFLVKPTAAQLGISTFFVALCRSPSLLKRPHLWLAWLGMLTILGLHLYHASELYLQYGNTFGVLSGGDSKLPKIDHLLSGQLLFAATRQAILWGPGPVAALAVALGVAFGLRTSGITTAPASADAGGPASHAFTRLDSPRESSALLLALLAGNLVWTLLALRYTVSQAGALYHVLGSVLGAFGVATIADVLAGSSLASRKAYQVASAGLAAGLVIWFSLSAHYRSTLLRAGWDESTLAAGTLLRKFAKPGSLVVVRSVEFGYDSVWRTPNNYQDPRVFYHSRTRGFSLSRENLSPKPLAEAVKAGALFYVEAEPVDPAPDLERYLSEHGRLLGTTPFGGRLFALVE